MFKRNDKRRIYEIIDMYLDGKIDAWNLCTEFYYCYDLELDSKTLSDTENRLFSELSVISDRFTNFEDELKKYPKTYFSEDQLKEKILEVKNQLVNDI